MARSLARNTRVFASTLTRTALSTASNVTSQNTFEIKVLDGYSFSQDVATQEVGVNEADSEAGCASAGLARGTLSFNTALNPVDVSFGTYVRPYDNGSTSDCIERILWSSAMGTLTGWNNSISQSGTRTYTTTTDTSTYEYMTFGLATSNNNELLPLTLVFVLENATYVIEQFNVGTAEVDFSIDGIATINWSGNGSRVNEDNVIHNLFKSPGGTLTRTLTQDATTGQYLGVGATTTTTFLRNKLSTLELYNNELPNASDTFVPTDITGNTITDSGATWTIDGFNDYAIYSVTQDVWDIITDTTATTVVTLADHSAGGDDWTSDTIKIYPIIAMTNGVVDNTDTTAPTITDATLSLTPGDYAGGRIRKMNTNVTASILTNTGTAITLSEPLPTGWASNDEFLIFTSDQQAQVVYCIPITGGTVTLENNVTYLTPEELAIVNLPLAGFAGNRVTSGSFTAYLNTGAQGSGGLLQDLLAKIEDSVTTNYHLTLHMGADSTSYPRVDFDMPHAQVTVPTTNVEDIISTEISFSAKPWDTANDVASFEDTNELTVTYAVTYTA